MTGRPCGWTTPLPLALATPVSPTGRGAAAAAPESQKKEIMTKIPSPAHKIRISRGVTYIKRAGILIFDQEHDFKLILDKKLWISTPEPIISNFDVPS
jgi:hypothetical protein